LSGWGNVKEIYLKRALASASGTAANANESAAKANERAATLQKEAEQARLETEQLKQQLGWRDLTSDQEQHIVEYLDGHEPRFVIGVYWGMGDAEASHFAQELALMLRKHHFDVVGVQPIGQLLTEQHGIEVSGQQDRPVEVLAAALEHAGLKGVSRRVSPGPVNTGERADIFVGYRRPPKLNATGGATE
jgi:hypothetical protein